jgi:hypothetical protein
MNADAPPAANPVKEARGQIQVHEPTMNPSRPARTYIPDCEYQRTQVEINL